MDIYCPKCSEPVDTDYFHDIAESTDSTWIEVSRAFQQIGCEALGDSHGEGESNPYASALYDLLGDDVDGAAAMMEDYPEYF
jgi:hypothetical protein